MDVRVYRTIRAGEWSTICLPFAMTEAQVKAAFGNDVKLGDFNGYNVTDDGDDTVGESTILMDKGPWAKDNRQRMMDNEFHDLQGRWVAKPSKGLYIVNGRKVVVK